MTQPPPQGPNEGNWTPPPAPGQHPSPNPAPQPGQWSAPNQPYRPDQGPPTYEQYPPHGYGQYGQEGSYQPTQPYAPPGDQWTPQPQQPPKRRAPLIASLVAVVALAGGGAITYVALSDSSDGGAATPKAAVEKAIGDLENADLVGMLDDLAPGERDALAGPLRDEIDKLKELKVLSSDADGGAVSGFRFDANNLKYDAKTVTINDHVQIVQITGGTIDISGDASKFPFSSEFRDAVGRNGASLDAKDSAHVDLADVGRNDGAPVRIATEKVGGRWYPSLVYTIADQAAKHRTPAASEAIPAEGAGSPEDAVRNEVDALLAGDLKTALAGLSPTEAGAVHDYGGMILDAAGSSYPQAGVQVTTLDLTTTALSGGAQLVGLDKLVLTRDGEQFSIDVDGDCVAIGGGGNDRRVCAADAATQLQSFLGFLSCSGFDDPSCDRDKQLTDAQRTAIGHVFNGLLKVGIVTTQADGQWYVAPLRSYTELGSTVLSELQGNDLLELINLVAPN